MAEPAILPRAVDSRCVLALGSVVAFEPVAALRRELALGEHVANPAVGVVDVVADPGVGQLEGQRYHVGDLAELGLLLLLAV